MEIQSIIFLSAVLCISTLTDIRTQKIPNRLTYPAMLLALGYHLFVGGASGPIFSATGLALGMGVFLIPYLMGGMGAGDVKLMGAVGAVVGAEGVFRVILYTALVGGIYAIVLLSLRSGPIKGVINRQWEGLKNVFITRSALPSAAAVDAKQPKLCYGVAIALGSFVYMGLEISLLGQIV